MNINTNTSNNTRIKLALLGKSDVGKTTLVTNLIHNIFKHHTTSTVGASYNCLTLGDHKLDVWDTAGQERYLALSSMYYRGSNIILLLFDMSEPMTINRLSYYLDKIIEEVDTDYKCIIIGNKCDLIKDLNELERIQIQTVTELNKYNSILKSPLEFVFTSVKTGYNMNTLKDKIISACDNIKQNRVYKLNFDETDSDSIYDKNKNINITKCCY